MSVFLVDFENVHNGGLHGISKCSSKDTVFIFYNKFFSKLSQDSINAVSKSKAKIDCIVTKKTAKDYMDFQIDSLLGYLIGATAQTEFYIVSKDKGYESIIDLYRDNPICSRKIEIHRILSIAEVISKKAKTFR